MNILLVCDYFPPEKLGGVGEIARSLFDEYRKLSHSVYVLSTGRERNQVEGVYRTGPNMFIGVIRNNWRVVQLIRKLDIDVVHLHQASTTLFLLLRLINRLDGVTVIASYQVSYVEEMKQVHSINLNGLRVKPTVGELVEKYLFGPIHVILDTIGFQLADVVTAVSRDTRREIERSYACWRQREVRVVPNGSSPLTYDESQDLDPEFARLVGDNLVLLYLGVFRMRKRIFNVLLAMRQLLSVDMPVVLVLVGGGRNYERRIAKACERLGIADNVIPIGPVAHERVHYYFRNADVLCVPSSYEGMPMAILEAMAVGCVVVATEVSGMKDLIDDRRTGFLVPVDDTEALARTIREVMENADLRQAVREAARSEVQDNYSWGSIADRYLQLTCK